MRDLIVGFDLDLTLVDSAEGIVATYDATLADFGCSAPRQEILDLIGFDLRETATRLVPNLDPDAVVTRYRELYPSLGVPGSTLLPGAARSLAAVHELGGSVHVVSSKATAAVQRMVEYLGLEVDVVIGGLFGAAKGEYLAGVRAAMYVGDHPGDMLAAHVAGAFGVGVTTGPHDSQALRAAGADAVLTTLVDFPAVLSDLIQRTVPEDGEQE